MTTPAAHDYLSALTTTAAEKLRDNDFAEVQREHAEVRRLLKGVAVAVRQGDSTSLIAALMAELVAQLRAHFAMEESDGVFDQVERDAPHLAGEIVRLRHEHAELLAEAVGLAALGRDIRNTGGQQQFEHLFRRFRDRVAVHESDENIVVQRAYADDVGTKD